MSEAVGTARWDAYGKQLREAALAAAVEAIEREGPGVDLGALARERPTLRPLLRDTDGVTSAVLAWNTQQIATRVTDALAGAAPVAADAVIGIGVSTALEWIEAHPTCTRFGFQHGWQSTMFADVLRATMGAEAVSQVQTEDEPWTLALTASAIIGAAETSVSWWVRTDYAAPRAEVAARLTRHLQAILNSR